MARDAFRIDSHKLMLHPRRVGDWLEGRNIYPIYMELSPAGACNHRCRFCGLDFIGYRPDFMDADMLGVRLLEMGRLGVKSIMYAGEGEPFMHKRMTDIIRQTKAAGIDCAITTNARTTEDRRNASAGALVRQQRLPGSNSRTGNANRRW